MSNLPVEVIDTIDLEERKLKLQERKLELERSNWKKNVHEASQLIKTVGIIPDQWIRTNQETLMFTIEHGRNRFGWDPITCLNNFILIKGKLSMFTQAMLALVEKSGKLENKVIKDLKDKDGKPEGCAVTLTRINNEPVTKTFTRQDAITAKLWGSNTWNAYPADMLYNRAMSRCLKQVFADVLEGVTSYEDTRDSQDADTPSPVKDMGEIKPTRTESMKAKLAPVVEEIEEEEPVEEIDPVAEAVEAVLEKEPEAEVKPERKPRKRKPKIIVEVPDPVMETTVEEIIQAPTEVPDGTFEDEIEEEVNSELIEKQSKFWDEFMKKTKIGHMETAEYLRENFNHVQEIGVYQEAIEILQGLPT